MSLLTTPTIQLCARHGTKHCTPPGIKVFTPNRAGVLQRRTHGAHQSSSTTASSHRAGRRAPAGASVAGLAVGQGPEGALLGERDHVSDGLLAVRLALPGPLPAALLQRCRVQDLGLTHQAIPTWFQISLFPPSPHLYFVLLPHPGKFRLLFALPNFPHLAAGKTQSVQHPGH